MFFAACVTRKLLLDDTSCRLMMASSEAETINRAIARNMMKGAGVYAAKIFGPHLLISACDFYLCVYRRSNNNKNGNIDHHEASVSSYPK